MRKLITVPSTLLGLAGFFGFARAVFPEESSVIDDDPMTISTVTGQTAILPCSVDPRYTEQYADQYKVIWVNPHDTAVSLQDRRILNDMRISIERPYLQDWNLHIRNVSLTDAGVYKCQINTQPVGTKLVKLIVQEPPTITDYTRPTDIERPEGDSVEIFCNATGTPPPNITWYRLNKRNMEERQHVGKTGEVLVIRNVSRTCADTYECVAENQVPPKTSQTFKVTVMYAPEIVLPNKRLGQYAGKDTILECEVTAFPLGKVLWKHNNKELSNSMTHELNLYNSVGDKVILSLRLLEIRAEDFGDYFCYADNEQGVTTDKMTLYEIKPKKTTTTTTTTLSPRGWNPRHQTDGSQSSFTHYNGYNENYGLVGDGQNSNGYRPKANSKDEALRSGNGDGSSKYTGVRADGDHNAGCQLWTSAHLILTMSATLFWFYRSCMTV